MKHLHGVGLAVLVAGTLVLAACGDDDDDVDDGAGADAGSSPTSTATAEATTAPSDGAAQDSGSATLTIGDETWEFDSFGCAFGHEATQSDVYAFSSNSFGEHSDGHGIQMQANIRDESGAGRYEGDGIVFEIDIDDIDDFENPSVSWSSSNTRGVPSDTVLSIDGDNLSASGLFDDTRTDERETVEGTLEAVCGSDSRR